MNTLQNPKDIKYHVARYLNANRQDIQGKTVIDVPAGSGVTSQLLLDLGAHVMAFDLFPEYFKPTQITCTHADITQDLPLDDHVADMLICQEGIEHFSDQLRVLKTFNRVLKPQGKLVITTPSYSNLAARLSYLLFESETLSSMPPNEINDIWVEGSSSKIYHGHIFMIGLQKLRLLARLAGFRVREVRYVRLSRGSLVLFPIFYPFILLRALLSYRRHMRKLPNLDTAQKQSVYREQLWLNINPKHLLNKHTFIVFEKVEDWQDVHFAYDAARKTLNEET